MKEHAVIVPTALGPVGGIVTEPEGRQSGAAIVLHGLGPPARAGVNAVFTHVARDLAAFGLVVLRFDFACEGDSTVVGVDVSRDIGWRRSTDLAMLRDVAPWFLERCGERELIFAASCHGARVALEFAAHDPAARGLFFVTPYLWLREPHLRGDAPDDEVPPGEPVWANGPTLDSREDLIRGLRIALDRGPVWMLVGEPEVEDAMPFARGLERGGDAFELEVVEGLPIHPVGHPRQQEEVRRRLPARVARALREREAAAAASP